MKLPAFSVAEPDYHDFSPPLLRLQASSPNPLGRRVLWLLAALLGLLIAWALIGRLDIVAVAEGKLVPHSYLKIVQPAESGIVREILVREGERVRAGQVLMRMDTRVSDADAARLKPTIGASKLTLARIDAELANAAYSPAADDPPQLAREIAAQYRANRAALDAALAEETSRLIRYRHDLASSEQVRAKLVETLPHYQQQDAGLREAGQGRVCRPLMASDKKRERIEKEQEHARTRST
jgi:hemolysin D